MKTKKQNNKSAVPRVAQDSKRKAGVLRSRLALVLALVLAGGATWALFEFVVWNKVPQELVGKWEVAEGPKEYRGAVFQFFRNGDMEGMVDVGDYLNIIKSTIRVEGKKIFVTSKHPRTGQEATQVQLIRTLTATELVVEDERANVLKMVRTSRQ
jgi:uncharacterized protein (TIGR03066 family)